MRSLNPFFPISSFHSFESNPKSFKKLSEHSIIVPSVFVMAIASGEFSINASNKDSLIFSLSSSFLYKIFLLRILNKIFRFKYIDNYLEELIELVNYCFKFLIF